MREIFSAIIKSLKELFEAIFRMIFSWFKKDKF